MAFDLASCSPPSRVWNGGLELISEDFLRVVLSVLADSSSLDIRRRPVVFGYIACLLAVARSWCSFLMSLLEADHQKMEATLRANPGGSSRALEARYDAIRVFYHLLVSKWVKLYPAYLHYSGVPAKPLLAECSGACPLSLAVPSPWVLLP
jgi:hypothetical protein